MSDARAIRTQTTSVRRGDGRVAGSYEQSSDVHPAEIRPAEIRPAEIRPADAQPTDPRVATPGGSSDGSGADDLPDSKVGLIVDGLHGGPTELTLADLRALAGGDRLATLDDGRIEFIDLLAQLRVRADADVVSFRTPAGRMFVSRIDSLLIDGRVHFEVLGSKVLGSKVPGSRVPGSHVRGSEIRGSSNEDRPVRPALVRLHGAESMGQRRIDVVSMRFWRFVDFIRGDDSDRPPA